MTAPTAVIFDVGNVLYGWDPQSFLERQLPEDEARLRFIEDVDLWGWHDTLDAGRPFAEAAAELSEAERRGIAAIFEAVDAYSAPAAPQQDA